MTVLPPSFLGKKVFLDGEKTKYYTLKYEEPAGKASMHALLFDHEVPVIFATLDHSGKFLDSFYLSNKSTKASEEVLHRYKHMADRKKQHRMTQEDIKDSLRSKEAAKMKNENITKLLKDEHLEDIKHLWSSRLLTLQKSDGTASDSLIMTTLQEAIDEANPMKSFHFLVKHRQDSLIIDLASKINENVKLLDGVYDYYYYHQKGAIVENFVVRAGQVADLTNSELIENLLLMAKNLEDQYSRPVLRPVLSRLLKRVKTETDETVKEWLNNVITNSRLRHSVLMELKRPKTSV
ncbi:hypothetical protein FLK61_28075 [Paenalkalicoccus suaedae]|uniref:Uncharacterized protein n=1 Tax=Paenalkalicoccus suaedae TaxID=2592382 RepID=A0A859FC25_9BACI|nr:hypothetical protein [Paenalkalicoccus suaedae]QKS70607.1 hypothetical protein FLK61_28075 [Paenalkalicoccus suaedae]